MAWGDDDDYDGYATCEYCEKRFPEDEPHVCEAMRKAEKEKSAAWEKQYIGQGLVKGRLVIDYVCFDSKDSFNHMLNLVSLGGGFETGTHDGSDGHDGQKTIFWKTQHEKKLL